tara:strand:- start:3285 stop:3653 length:369 start_codon:yes stop_codon:yes gene_type:complete
MGSLAVSLPLSTDSNDGYKMIKGFKKLIRQNLKSLILTLPGERVMQPTYGVGLKQYLFSNFSERVFHEAQDKIIEQAALYLPQVSILDIQFPTKSPDDNYLSMRIIYSIPAINSQDLLEVRV